LRLLKSFLLLLLGAEYHISHPKVVSLVNVDVLEVVVTWQDVAGIPRLHEIDIDNRVLLRLNKRVLDDLQGLEQGTDPSDEVFVVDRLQEVNVLPVLSVQVFRYVDSESFGQLDDEVLDLLVSESMLQHEELLDFEAQHIGELVLILNFFEDQHLFFEGRICRIGVCEDRGKGSSRKRESDDSKKHACDRKDAFGGDPCQDVAVPHGGHRSDGEVDRCDVQLQVGHFVEAALLDPISRALIIQCFRDKDPDACLEVDC